jgi:hypothetical protein
VPGETLQTAVDRALEAYSGLTGLGETVDDEWSYVNDLSDAWRERFETLVTERGGEPLPDEVSRAIDRAIDVIGRIGDPHRAIDWLSTYPQVVLVALRATP